MFNNSGQLHRVDLGCASVAAVREVGRDRIDTTLLPRSWVVSANRKSRPTLSRATPWIHSSGILRPQRDQSLDDTDPVNESLDHGVRTQPHDIYRKEPHLHRTSRRVRSVFWQRSPAFLPQRQRDTKSLRQSVHPSIPRPGRTTRAPSLREKSDVRGIPANCSQTLGKQFCPL